MYILYIEDNQNDVDLTRRYFARQTSQIIIDHARTLAEAFSKLAHCTNDRPIYDLILTDMRLPDGDGLKVLAHVRATTLPLPVVVLTGTGSEEMAVAALKGGAEDYITKRHDYLERLPSVLENSLARFRATVSRHNQPLHVLYAEHNAADIDLTRRHLARYAPYIELTVVHTGAEVLQELTSCQDVNYFHILLLDYRLPGMNALDLLKELAYRNILTLPVVLVTGQGDEEVAVQALRLGIADYLVKNSGYLFHLPRMLENTYTQSLLQRERTALFESEQRYRTLFDHAPVMIFTKDVAGVYTSANALTVEVFGCNPVGLTDEKIFSPQVASRLRMNDQMVMEQDITDLLEESFPSPQGNRHILSRKSPLRDRRGNISGLLGIGLDITERILSEEAQLENQRRLAQLVEHVDEVIWLSETQEHKLLYISQTYAQVWGRTVASVYDNPASMLNAIVKDDAEIALQFAEALAAGYGISLEFRIERPDGAIAWISVRTFPIENEQGKVYRVAGLARDITERRRTEEHLQQQERLATVGQMAAGIAHDFNNILAIIMLYTQMLQISVHESNHQRHLTTIYQQALHGANLVQQILDFSRRSTVERVTLDIVPFLKELVRLFQRTLQENIRVELESPHESFVISADPSRLQQALMNIAINARDAMPQGGTLRLSVSHVTFTPDQQWPVANMTHGHWLCIGIRDSGTGIPPEVLPHIFDPFYTTKPTGMGTGLGLSQVYGIVHLLDGFIDVKSEVGAGTLFTIYLPLVQQGIAQPTDELAPVPRGKGQIVLLVEDEEALREAMAEMLTELGYRVLQAADGGQAIALFDATHAGVDIVVSDLVMPGMGGAEIYQELSPRLGIDKPLRMLLVTGYPQESLIRWQNDRDVVRWLQKPFTMASLAHHVAETLQGN